MNEAGEIHVCPDCTKLCIGAEALYNHECPHKLSVYPMSIKGLTSAPILITYACKYCSKHFVYEADRDAHQTVTHERMEPKALQHVRLYLDHHDHTYYFVFVPAPSEGLGNIGIKLHAVADCLVRYGYHDILLKEARKVVAKIVVSYDQLVGALKRGMHPDIIELDVVLELIEPPEAKNRSW